MLPDESDLAPNKTPISQEEIQQKLDRSTRRLLMRYIEERNDARHCSGRERNE